MLFRTFLPLLALALAAPAAAAPGARSDLRRAALDRDIPRLLAERRVPSVSIAVIEDGRISMTAAYGEQSPGVRATPDTLYNVASLTKPVSAEVVLRLASQGRLTLDEPMHRHWVDPDVAADPRHKLLTPRLALSHRTGFPNWRFLAADKKLAFGYTPGESTGYSGEGYEYVARFAEKKQGKSFEKMAEALVLAPSGMRSTAFTKRDWFAGRIAVPTDAEGKALEPNVRDSFLASDDMYTTASDYARFMIAVMNRTGLSRDIAAQRESVQASTWQKNCAGAKPGGCPPELGFGLGWEVLKFPHATILWHTGADRGEFTAAFFSPQTRDGAVVLTNAKQGFSILLDVLERVGADPVFVAALRAQSGS